MKLFPRKELAALPKGTLIEYGLLDKGSKGNEKILEEYAQARHEESFHDQLASFQHRSFFLTGFFQNANADEGGSSIIISRTGELLPDDDVEYHRLKPISLDNVTHLAVLERIPEYELRDMKLIGNMLTPHEQEYGVLTRLDYLQPKRGCFLTSGYIVGANLGKGLMRLAHGYKPNPLFKIGKQDFPLRFHSIESIPYSNIFSISTFRRDRFLDIANT